VTISSTHGVEGYCGSGFQVDWLASVGAAGLPRDTAAVMVHAINPYGFAWTRRVTEEGNDLNRNYVDHRKPYPVNEGYLEIADFLMPKDLSEADAEAAEAKLADYRKKVGDVAYFRAVSGGQYSHPTACSSAAAARAGRTAPCTPSPTSSSRAAATSR
jgi:hypothetical protein